MRGIGGCVPWEERARAKVRVRVKEKVMVEREERASMEKVRERVRLACQVEGARRGKVRERGRDRRADAGIAEEITIAINAPRRSKVPPLHQVEEEEDRQISLGGYRH